jgi:hypothetical protein
MPALIWLPTLLYFLAVATLGAVYLWSTDAGRRERALRLLRLVIGSRIARRLIVESRAKKG